MKTVLLTGGRAPATLDLARALHRAGHSVVLAESLRRTLTGYSKAVARTYQIPAPVDDPCGFVAALETIIRREGVDVLIPTCEEIFHIARHHARLSQICTVFCEPLERLQPLHHKGDFIQRATSYGLAVPETCVIGNAGELATAFHNWGQVVLKPIYSRFAARTLIGPPLAQAQRAIAAEPPGTWVAQRYVAGRELCTYSIAHAGRLVAHSCYAAQFTAGRGVTVAFRPLNHAGCRAWVAAFVGADNFTGQIAFDFIEDARGTIYALECNPRTTSGLHLLALHSHLPRAFWDADLECITPAPDTQAMVGVAMLGVALASGRSRHALRQWWQTFRASRDVIGARGDNRPLWGQVASLLELAGVAARNRISLTAASTRDIEWNGKN